MNDRTIFFLGIVVILVLAFISLPAPQVSNANAEEHEQTIDLTELIKNRLSKIRETQLERERFEAEKEVLFKTLIELLDEEMKKGGE